MTGWFRSKDEIPPKMIGLSALPVDNEGAPVWNNEIEQLTKQFGEDFVAPFLVETAPGMCYGGYVAKAHYVHAVRTYSATAVLITRQNDELRTTVSITAPQSSSGGQWKPYYHVYTASLPKEHLENIVHTIGGLCEQSHAQELIKKGQRTSSSVHRLPLASLRTSAMSDFSVFTSALALPRRPKRARKCSVVTLSRANSQSLLRARARLADTVPTAAP